jgi:hypothetical protein
MRATITGFVFTAIFLLATASASTQPSRTDPLGRSETEAAGATIRRLLDGRVYSVDTGKAGKPSGGKDVIRFTDGIVSTDLCIKFGFKPAPYMVRVDGPKVHFRSEMISEKQGKLVVSGHIEGKRLKAHAEWAQVRWYWTVNVNLWFDGELADPNSPLSAHLN